eukprot:71651_1
MRQSTSINQSGSLLVPTEPQLGDWDKLLILSQFKERMINPKEWDNNNKYSISFEPNDADNAYGLPYPCNQLTENQLKLFQDEFKAINNHLEILYPKDWLTLAITPASHFNAVLYTIGETTKRLNPKQQAFIVYKYIYICYGISNTDNQWAIIKMFNRICFRKELIFTRGFVKPVVEMIIKMRLLESSKNGLYEEKQNEATTIINNAYTFTSLQNKIKSETHKWRTQMSHRLNMSSSCKFSNNYEKELKKVHFAQLVTQIADRLKYIETPTIESTSSIPLADYCETCDKLFYRKDGVVVAQTAKFYCIQCAGKIQQLMRFSGAQDTMSEASRQYRNDIKQLNNELNEEKCNNVIINNNNGNNNLTANNVQMHNNNNNSESQNWTQNWTQNMNNNNELPRKPNQSWFDWFTQADTDQTNADSLIARQQYEFICNIYSNNNNSLITNLLLNSMQINQQKELWIRRLANITSEYQQNMTHGTQISVRRMTKTNEEIECALETDQLKYYDPKKQYFALKIQCDFDEIKKGSFTEKYLVDNAALLAPQFGIWRQFGAFPSKSRVTNIESIIKKNPKKHLWKITTGIDVKQYYEKWKRLVDEQYFDRHFSMFVWTESFGKMYVATGTQQVENPCDW